MKHFVSRKTVQSKETITKNHTECGKSYGKGKEQYTLNSLKRHTQPDFGGQDIYLKDE